MSKQLKLSGVFTGD